MNINANFEYSRLLEYKSYYVDDIEEIKNKIDNYCKDKKVSDCLEYIESRQREIKDLNRTIEKIDFALQFLKKYID